MANPNDMANPDPMVESSPDPSPDPAPDHSQSLTLEQAIANLRQIEDPSLRYYAAWWFGKFRVREPEAIELLLIALADETDRGGDGGYPLRRNAAKALGKVGDRAVVPALITCLDCEDYYVRESAAIALAEIGLTDTSGDPDDRAVLPLLNLLDGGLAAAQRVPGKPHLTQPYDAVIEALGDLGASAAIAAIEPFLHHDVEKVGYSAARALYQLTQDPRYGEILVTALHGPDLQMRRSALMDIGAVGYLPGAQAIANTLAENSLKLISLKGVVETQLERQPAPRSPIALSPEIITVLDLMDGLL
jgi:phycocyanobilin lyase subunit alpha